MIIGLEAGGDQDIAEVRPDNEGAIDSPGVSRLVKDVLEGGKEAFEMRRRKYGF